MHRYLRAVGLKSLDSKKKVRNFLDRIIENPDTTHIVQDGPESNIAVLTKQITDRAGIAVCGEFEDRDMFRMDSYFPYVTSEEMSTYVTCSVGKMAGSDGYSGMCEDYRLGVSLIFFLVNFCSMACSSFTCKWLLLLTQTAALV